MLDRIAEPLFWEPPPHGPRTARDLALRTCSVEHARLLNRAWHSRLPRTQRSPWQYAFRMEHGGVTYAVALWHNPSARTLPGHWLELRRMAVAPDAPHCTASRFLSEMWKWFREHCPERERMISYQDEAVHLGTIYKAAGWTATHRQAARRRDRSKPRPSGRAYRTNQNSDEVDASPKVRWEKAIND